MCDLWYCYSAFVNPMGLQNQAYCQHHCESEWLHFADRDGRLICQVINGPSIKTPDSFFGDCGVCGRGEPTLDHWLHICPVIHWDAHRLGIANLLNDLQIGLT